MVATGSTSNPDGILATTYTIIHSFLKSRSHDIAAAAVRKAAKDVVVLRDGVQAEEASLDEIIKWWKQTKTPDASKSDSSQDSDFGSSSWDVSSDSDSSSSDSSSGSDSDSSSKSTLSSSNHSGAENLGSELSKTQTTSPNGKSMGLAPEPGERTKTDAKEMELSQESKKIVSKHDVKTEEPSSSSSGSSSESDSDSGGNTSEKRPAIDNDITLSTKTTKKVSVAMAEPDGIRSTKKRRISESGNAVVTSMLAESPIEVPTPKPAGKVNGKQPRKNNAPFRRVTVDAVEFHDERLKDNTFDARGGSTSDYGARASQDLMVTRGDGFRKEKNKKKRGSYRGGDITLQSLSVKFK